MELWEIEARECIRDLTARYNSYGDEGDFAALVELFAPDAVVEVQSGVIFEGRYEGREAISAFFEDCGKLVSGLFVDRPIRYVHHSVTTHRVDFADREHASGRAYYSVVMEHGLDHWGRYGDEYRRVGDRWLFARRYNYLDGWVDVAGGMGVATLSPPAQSSSV